MVFSSMTFLWIFLPLILGINGILQEKYRNIFLLIASLVFYSWGEPVYILLMLFSIVINYFFGLLVENTSPKSFWIAACILVNLTLLGYFKYYNFTAQTINSLLKNQVVPFKNVVLPIGISFYTFQILSYVIDVYRKKTPAQRNIVQLALYVSLFPQLIAGPIVQYHDVAEQIKHRQISISKTYQGAKRFSIGLAKKVIISNSVAQVVDKVFALQPQFLSTSMAWIGICFYTLQIYFDFSGYSDMAIGLGKMLGFEFLENFNYPYISRSVQEFWRRWHISLSTWFREYLYIPLGGNRKGRVRTYVNLTIVFFCTGLWHGANWTFIVWGLFHGAFMVLERLFLGKLLQKNPYKIINHAYTLLVVLIGWVFFRSDTLSYAINYISAMFSFKETALYSIREIVGLKSVLIACCGIVGSGIIHLFSLDDWIKRLFSTNGGFAIECLTVFALMVYCTLSLAGGAYNPFIYFRF